MAEFMEIDLRVRRPRHVRPILDPLEQFDEVELHERFRFDSESIAYITELIRPSLKTAETTRNRPVSPETQVCVALRYFASNSNQQVVGDTFGIDQSTVSRIVDTVTESLAAKVPDFMSFPADNDERSTVQNGFYKIAKFPGVVACVDGTHIRIQSPGTADAAAYINRKNYTSLNVSAACDFRRKFVHLVARWPGRSHDSWILRQSNLWDAFEMGQVTGVVLGDSGYPSRKWLLTLYLNPQTDAQKSYNKAQKKTRVLIEQAFGILKRRFSILHGEVRIKPSKVAKIVGACAVLHNIATDRNQPLPQQPHPPPPPQPELLPYHGNLNTGLAYRDHIAQTIFACPQQ